MGGWNKGKPVPEEWKEKAAATRAGTSAAREQVEKDLALLKRIKAELGMQ
ncbi:MAG: hypothetical protein IPK79_01020 [Vampirovibrionales bacterium]|nr:hypothetical protein [Vampirovibrionales bacterium]